MSRGVSRSLLHGGVVSEHHHGFLDGLDVDVLWVVLDCHRVRFPVANDLADTVETAHRRLYGRDSALAGNVRHPEVKDLQPISLLPGCFAASLQERTKW